MLRDMIANHVRTERIPKKLNIIHDTTNFIRVDYDDVLILNERPYFIRHCEKEGRFGIEDQPKFWVRRAVDLYTGKTKIIKMVFLEKFRAQIGNLVFDRFRSPKKEARILDLVRDHPNFMHGMSVKDSAGNIIRIMDYIVGKALAEAIPDLGADHEDYFYNYFPGVLDDYITLIEAIDFLHKHSEKHGDIRRDHIIKDKRSGNYRCIDFDFDYWHKENMFGFDLSGLGNILVYLTGHGDVTTYNLQETDHPALTQLNDDDLNIIFKNRVANLKKVYPYIPDSLNLVMLHFSAGAETFYDDTGQLLSDLVEAKDNLY
jgi:hypothetical protein